jgi:hypothetical protein
VIGDEYALYSVIPDKGSLDDHNFDAVLSHFRHPFRGTAACFFRCVEGPALLGLILICRAGDLGRGSGCQQDRESQNV